MAMIIPSSTLTCTTPSPSDRIWNRLTFSSDARSVQMTFGQGNMKPKVTIQPSNVQQPILRITGHVGPVDGKIASVLESKTSIETTGGFGLRSVTFQINEAEDTSDVQIKCQDRELVIFKGERVPFLLPELYPKYGELIIEGSTAEIDILDLEIIVFNKLSFKVRRCLH
ncbi:hypothetical protein MVEG_05816 [Podila verticillata NRRL 6337]|nr:hypothetical protein MVEG_05816 [Podila verticillata NRRL 6337]